MPRPSASSRYAEILRREDEQRQAVLAEIERKARELDGELRPLLGSIRTLRQDERLTQGARLIRARGGLYLELSTPRVTVRVAHSQWPQLRAQLQEACAGHKLDLSGLHTPDVTPWQELALSAHDAERLEHLEALEWARAADKAGDAPRRGSEGLAGGLVAIPWAVCSAAVAIHGYDLNTPSGNSLFVSGMFCVLAAPIPGIITEALFQARTSVGKSLQLREAELRVGNPYSSFIFDHAALEESDRALQQLDTRSQAALERARQTAPGPQALPHTPNVQAPRVAQLSARLLELSRQAQSLAPAERLSASLD